MVSDSSASASSSDSSLRSDARQITRLFVWLPEKVKSTPRGNNWDRLNRAGRVKELQFGASFSARRMRELIFQNFPALAAADVASIRFYMSTSKGNDMVRVGKQIPDAKNLLRWYRKASSRRVYILLAKRENQASAPGTPTSTSGINALASTSTTTTLSSTPSSSCTLIHPAMSSTATSTLTHPIISFTTSSTALSTAHPVMSSTASSTLTRSAMSSNTSTTAPTTLSRPAISTTTLTTFTRPFVSSVTSSTLTHPGMSHSSSAFVTPIHPSISSSSAFTSSSTLTRLAATLHSSSALSTPIFPAISPSAFTTSSTLTRVGMSYLSSVLSTPICPTVSTTTASTTSSTLTPLSMSYSSAATASSYRCRSANSFLSTTLSTQTSSAMSSSSVSPVASSTFTHAAVPSTSTFTTSSIDPHPVISTVISVHTTSSSTSSFLAISSLSSSAAARRMPLPTNGRETRRYLEYLAGRRTGSSTTITISADEDDDEDYIEADSSPQQSTATSSTRSTSPTGFISTAFYGNGITAGTVKEDLSPHGLGGASGRNSRTDEVAECQSVLQRGNKHTAMLPFLNHSFEELCWQARKDKKGMVVLLVNKRSRVDPKRENILRMLHKIESSHHCKWLFWVADTCSNDGGKVLDMYGGSLRKEQIRFLAPSMGRTPNLLGQISDADTDAESIVRKVAERAGKYIDQQHCDQYPQRETIGQFQEKHPQGSNEHKRDMANTVKTSEVILRGNTSASGVDLTITTEGATNTSVSNTTSLSDFPKSICPPVVPHHILSSLTRTSSSYTSTSSSSTTISSAVCQLATSSCPPSSSVLSCQTSSAEIQTQEPTTGAEDNSATLKRKRKDQRSRRERRGKKKKDQ